MTEEALKERKEGLLALMEDPSYVPMKLKELSMLLNVPRERREELKEVLAKSDWIITGKSRIRRFRSTGLCASFSWQER